jgi:D-alanyl-D-alanine dipeptidase
MRQILILSFLLCVYTLHAADCHPLVDIQTVNSRIQVDLRYATAGNPLGRPFYPSSTLFVDSYVATRLGRVQKELEKQGMGLVIYEGYRPPSVQRALDMCRCEKGSECYRFDDAAQYRKGVGVDVAIYYLEGQPLQLPTPWGVDCEEAHQDYYHLPAHVYHNRTLLTELMMRNGFVPLRERWWHFDLKGWQNSPELPYEYVDLVPYKKG